MKNKDEEPSAKQAGGRQAEAREHGLEDQLLLQAKRLEAIGTLADGVAQDLSTLVQAMHGNVQLLLSRKMDEGPDVRPLRELERITKRVAEIVQHLLTFSRKTRPPLALVDMNVVVGRTMEKLRPTTPGSIAVRTELKSDLPELCADASQMEQVLSNLLKNAFEAMEGEGVITVTTGLANSGELPSRRRTDEKKESYVLLGVRDTGRGMEPELLKRVYEPFFTTKQAGEATGLGLSTVYGIVKSHNGLIRSESTPGKGTSFSVYLPLDQSCSIGDQPRQDTPAERIAGAGNKTVLVVDDEDVIREMTSEILRQSGYRVLNAASGEEALDAYGENAVDLVLLDLVMPGMGGERCLKELLRIDRSARVIITTGHSGHQLERSDAVGYLTKPYDHRTLLRAVRDRLGGEQPLNALS
jgi:nitrogen-specific signal transduction histidine kinase/ActR/RegA family two-component response regulator